MYRSFLHVESSIPLPFHPLQTPMNLVMICGTDEIGEGGSDLGVGTA